VSLKDRIDTIVRDEAYDGSFGTMTEGTFNNMAARIADLVMEEVEAEIAARAPKAGA